MTFERSQLISLWGEHWEINLGLDKNLCLKVSLMLMHLFEIIYFVLVWYIFRFDKEALSDLVL